MHPAVSLLLVVAGLVVLNYGAEGLVRGASQLARRFGVSPLVIGLTVVAFGTSSPELVTSLIGGSTIAVGNVVGSNLFNIGLILGLTALVMPLACQGQFLRFEMPLMVALGPVLWLAAANDLIGRVEGALLLAGLIAFVVVSFRRSTLEPAAVQLEMDEAVPRASTRLGVSLLLVGAGLAGLIVGADVFLRGAKAIAELIGVPDRIIALTLVAGGTSIPELATSIVAARKGEGDIALGNLVGSNIFNILGIVGIVALVRPIVVPAGSLGFDIPAMILVQALCVPIMLTAWRVSRAEGAILLVSYAAYVLLLFLRG